jgi:hypothetical protein
MARWKLEPKMIEKSWKKWQSGNPKGQPRKGIGLVNDELKEKWYNPATKQDIETNYMSLLQLSKNELIELWKDESKPMLIRIIVKNMLWWKGFDIIEKMLDRWIWKSVQKVETKDTTWINESDLID